MISTNGNGQRISPRERDAIIQSLYAGVVPKLGLRHIQVGRAREIEELIKNIEKVREGGAAIRFVIGEYGSGKTFFLNLIQLVALEKGLVVMSADLAPGRRVHATGGQARSLYAELARNVSTRTKPNGGAMSSIVERFISQSEREAQNSQRETAQVIQEKLSHLEELTGGFSFAAVILRYLEGFNNVDDQLKSSALRWLRAEYSTKTEARSALGVRTIIDDLSVYDHLKVFAEFVCQAGYKGLLVSLDELVNIYKLTSSRARNANYEQILRILNDVLQGNAGHMGFVLGGTPEFLMDTRRGMYSYEALQSRLAENTFASDHLVDFAGPVMRLSSLSPEDIYVLLINIRRVMQMDNAELPDEALEAFMRHCGNRIGDAYFRTPRNTVKQFVHMLSILKQNPSAVWSDLIPKVEVSKDKGDDLSVTPEIYDDELRSIRIGSA